MRLSPLSWAIGDVFKVYKHSPLPAQAEPQGHWTGWLGFGWLACQLASVVSLAFLNGADGVAVRNVCGSARKRSIDEILLVPNEIQLRFGTCLR